MFWKYPFAQKRKHSVDCKPQRLEAPRLIGDTVWDEEAAHDASVPFIHAGYGFGQIDKPVLAITFIGELPALLLQMRNNSEQAIKA